MTRYSAPQSSVTMEAACARFNAAHPVGSSIAVWPGSRHENIPGEIVEVVEPGAYVLGGHTAVVQVTGGHGCITLSHTAPAPPPASGQPRGEHGTSKARYLYDPISHADFYELARAAFTGAKGKVNEIAMVRLLGVNRSSVQRWLTGKVDAPHNIVLCLTLIRDLGGHGIARHLAREAIREDRERPELGLYPFRDTAARAELEDAPEPIEDAGEATVERLTADGKRVINV